MNSKSGSIFTHIDAKSVFVVSHQIVHFDRTSNNSIAMIIIYMYIKDLPCTSVLYKIPRVTISSHILAFNITGTIKRYRNITVLKFNRFWLGTRIYYC